jgi:hypothetical protein
VTIWCADASGTGVDASCKVTLPCSGESKCTTQAAVSSSVRCLLIQLIPKITAIPCPSRTIKHVLYILPFKLRGGFMTTCLVKQVGLEVVPAIGSAGRRVTGGGEGRAIGAAC